MMNKASFVSMNVSMLRPAGCPGGIDPSEWRKAVSERIEQMATAMAALIEALDLMDGDADFEFNGDEQDVSAPEGWRSFDTTLLDDSEVAEADEDGDPAEPTLGASEQNPHTNHADQTHWATGRNNPGADDNEVENEHGGDILDVPHRWALA